MPIAMECERIIKVDGLKEALVPCQFCHQPFYFGQFALSLYERWWGLNYLVHAECEAPLIKQLERHENSRSNLGENHA